MLTAWREKFTGRPLALVSIAAVVGVVVADCVATVRGVFTLLTVIALAAAWRAWIRGGWGWLALLAMTVFASSHLMTLHQTRLHPLRIALQERGTAIAVEVWGRVEPTLRSD